MDDTIIYDSLFDDLLKNVLSLFRNVPERRVVCRSIFYNSILYDSIILFYTFDVEILGKRNSYSKKMTTFVAIKCS